MAKSKLFKNVSAFTDQTGSRPILSGIHFSGNGSVYATNAHIAVKVADLNTSEHEFVLHPDSMQQLSGSYPNVQRLIPVKSEENTVSLSNQHVTQLIAFCKQFKKDIITFELQEDSLKVSCGQVSTSLEVEYQGEEISLLFRAEYLRIVLTLFKEEKANQLTLQVSTPVRPVLLHEGSIEAIICPVRPSVTKEETE